MPMNRRRHVLPEQFQDELLNEQPIPVRYTALGLRLFADDEGRESTTETRIKAALYPMDRDVTEGDILDHLLRLDAIGWLSIYGVGARTFFAIAEVPRVEKPTPSRFPPPPESFRNDSGAAPERFPLEEREGEGGQRAGERARSGTDPASPPDPFCRTHPEGTESPCRACGVARLRHTKWVEEHVFGRTHQSEPVDDDDA